MKSLRFAAAAATLFAGLAVAAPAIEGAQVDALLEKAWAAQGVAPAGECTDSEFLRRLSLDVRGVIPTVQESIAFLADESPDKRTRVVDAWLASPERAEHWAAYWDKILVGTMEQPDNAAAQMRVKSHWRGWVAERFAANQPYDEFVREIVTADGDLREDPEVLPIARWRDQSENMAGSFSRVFLGRQIQCAQCHDHKDDPTLTQAKFWEFAAFFEPVTVTPLRKMDDGGLPTVLVSERPARWGMPIPEVEPKTMVEPKYLDGTPAMHEVVDESGKALTRREIAQLGKELQKLNRERRQMFENGQAPDPEMMMKLAENMPKYHDTRRDQLASMLFRQDEMQVARNMANRVWARYFGRGFVEPVDDWTKDSKASVPELLDALAAAFVDSGWDVRRLERAILMSRAYARSPMPTETSAPHPDLFAHAAVRPLAPEQMLDSLARATNSSPEDQAAIAPKVRDALRDRYVGEFIVTFDNDEMEWTSAFQTSIPRALFLLNDGEVNKAVQAREGSMLSMIDEAATTPDEAVDYLYLAALSRRATPEERAFVLDPVAAAPKGQAKARAAEDVFWGLLNSAEFVTNH